jgi:hypothetical protein
MLVIASKELVLKQQYFTLYLVAVTFISTFVCVCMYVCV